MEFEFDKEIDVILRKSREAGFDDNGRGRAGHLDADEISAFAENAVPDSARSFYVSHFAECSNCRKILASTLILNADAAPERDSPVAVVALSDIPWYRKLFGFPQLAYSLGSLILLFGAFLAYIAIRSTGDADVAGLSKPNEPALPQFSSASNANAPAANATNSIGRTSENAMPASNAVSPSNTTVASTATPSPSGTTSSVETPADKSGRLDDSVKKDLPVREERELDDQKRKQADTDVLAKATQSVNQPVAGASRNEEQVRDGAGANKELKSVDEPERTRSAPKLPPRSSTAQRQVGGKSFRSIGGVWFDTEYNNMQTQIPVKRGTADYQKLDSELRSIADQLGGTVVVAWKGKAYRIN